MEEQEPTTKTIQLEIERRATEKLRLEIQNINLFMGYKEPRKLIGPLIFRVDIGTPEKPDRVLLEDIFNDRDFVNKLFEKNIYRYIKQETELFLKEQKPKQALTQQKVERELSVINAEINALRFTLPYVDDLPY